MSVNLPASISAPMSLSACTAHAPGVDDRDPVLGSAGEFDERGKCAAARRVESDVDAVRCELAESPRQALAILRAAPCLTNAGSHGYRAPPRR